MADSSIIDTSIKIFRFFFVRKRGGDSCLGQWADADLYVSASNIFTNCEEQRRLRHEMEVLPRLNPAISD